MRILIISPTSIGIGGIARHVQGLKAFLEKNNHSVDIISSDNTLTIPIKKLKNPSFMVSSFLKTKFSKKYDIIHGQSIVAAFAMKNVKGKKLLAIHGIHHEQVEHLHGKTAGITAKNYENKAIHWVDAITVSSKDMLNYYSKKKIRTIFLPNAIDLSSISNKKNKLYEKQIIFAGRLSKEKGILEVIEMSKKLSKKTHLLILGSGPEENKIKELEKNYSNIHYLGFQNRESTLSYIAGSDLLIQPSHMEGGISYTLLESMACGTPIISTNVGDVKHTLTHMKNIYIVEKENPNDLLFAINFLMGNPETREQLKENALDEIQEHDWSIIGPKYINFYNEILNK